MKTFKVTLRKTISMVQVVTVQADNDLKAEDVAIDHLNEMKWEYDTDLVDVEEVEEVEDA
jgi:hypothetical protein